MKRTLLLISMMILGCCNGVAADAWNVRNIRRQPNVGNLDMTDTIKWYAEESVRYTVFPMRDGRALAIPEDCTTAWTVVDHKEVPWLHTYGETSSNSVTFYLAAGQGALPADGEYRSYVTILRGSNTIGILDRTMLTVAWQPGTTIEPIAPPTNSWPAIMDLIYNLVSNATEDLTQSLDTHISDPDAHGLDALRDDLGNLWRKGDTVTNATPNPHTQPLASITNWTDLLESDEFFEKIDSGNIGSFFDTDQGISMIRGFDGRDILFEDAIMAGEWEFPTRPTHGGHGFATTNQLGGAVNTNYVTTNQLTAATSNVWRRGDTVTNAVPNAHTQPLASITNWTDLLESDEFFEKIDSGNIGSFFDTDQGISMIRGFDGRDILFEDAIMAGEWEFPTRPTHGGHGFATTNQLGGAVNTNYVTTNQLNAATSNLWRRGDLVTNAVPNAHTQPLASITNWQTLLESDEFFEKIESGNISGFYSDEGIAGIRGFYGHDIRFEEAAIDGEWEFTTRPTHGGHGFATTNQLGGAVNTNYVTTNQLNAATSNLWRRGDLVTNAVPNAHSQPLSSITNWPTLLESDEFRDRFNTGLTDIRIYQMEGEPYISSIHGIDGRMIALEGGEMLGDWEFPTRPTHGGHGFVTTNQLNGAVNTNYVTTNQLNAATSNLWRKGDTVTNATPNAHTQPLASITNWQTLLESDEFRDRFNTGLTDIRIYQMEGEPYISSIHGIDGRMIALEGGEMLGDWEFPTRPTHGGHGFVTSNQLAIYATESNVAAATNSMIFNVSAYNFVQDSRITANSNAFANYTPLTTFSTATGSVWTAMAATSNALSTRITATSNAIPSTNGLASTNWVVGYHAANAPNLTGYALVSDLLGYVTSSEWQGGKTALEAKITATSNSIPSIAGLATTASLTNYTLSSTYNSGTGLIWTAMAATSNALSGRITATSNAFANYTPLTTFSTSTGALWSAIGVQSNRITATSNSLTTSTGALWTAMAATSNSLVARIIATSNAIPSIEGLASTNWVIEYHGSNTPTDYVKMEDFSIGLQNAIVLANNYHDSNPTDLSSLYGSIVELTDRIDELEHRYTNQPPVTNPIPPVVTGQWTSMTNLGLGVWQSISANRNGEVIVVAPTNGYIKYTKNFGESWSNSAFGGSRKWRAVQVSNEGNNYGAIVNGTYSYFRGTTSASNDILNSSGTAKNWEKIIVNSEGLFAAIAPFDSVVQFPYIVPARYANVNKVGANMWQTTYINTRLASIYDIVFLPDRALFAGPEGTWSTVGSRSVQIKWGYPENVISESYNLNGSPLFANFCEFLGDYSTCTITSPPWSHIIDANNSATFVLYADIGPNAQTPGLFRALYKSETRLHSGKIAGIVVAKERNSPNELGAYWFDATNNIHFRTSTNSVTQTAPGAKKWADVQLSDDGTVAIARHEGEGYIWVLHNSVWTAQTNLGSRVWKAVELAREGTAAFAIDSEYNYVFKREF